MSHIDDGRLNALLDGELLPGFDGKLRYPRAVRLRIFRGMVRMLRARAKSVPSLPPIKPEPRMPTRMLRLHTQRPVICSSFSG